MYFISETSAYMLQICQQAPFLGTWYPSLFFHLFFFWSFPLSFYAFFRFSMFSFFCPFFFFRHLTWLLPCSQVKHIHNGNYHFKFSIGFSGDTNNILSHFLQIHFPLPTDKYPNHICPDSITALSITIIKTN